LLAFRHFLAAARDLAMVPDVGPSSEKLAVERTNHGEWLVNVADDVVVPMTTLEVVDALRKGRLSEQSLVWRIGMHDWTAVLDVPQLRLAAGSLPPPQFASAVVAADVSEDVPSAVHPMLPTVPSSIAPTVTEAAGQSGHAREDWGDLEQILASERRADQRSSRRVVLGAALGSAALVATFTVLLLRSSPRHPVAPPAQPAQASEIGTSAPAPAPPTSPEAGAPTPSEAASNSGAVNRGSAAPRAEAEPTARPVKRAKRAAAISSASDASPAAPSLRPAPLPSDTAPQPAVVPAPPLKPLPSATAEPASPPSASASPASP